MTDAQSIVLGLVVCWVVPQLLLAAAVAIGLWCVSREASR